VSDIPHLWEQFAEDFRGDDRTLPDIDIERLSRAEVCEIYRWVRSQSAIYTEAGEPLLWNLVHERDVPITEVDDPCESLMAGRVEPFRHGLSRLTVGGVELPPLTIAVWPDRVAFDYQVGPAWGPPQLSALFELLWAIQRIAPSAEISHFHEGCNERTASFDLAWGQYRRSKTGETTT
jgi:hypothetical protein